MTINLFDDHAWQSLRPLTFTRPVADLRVGILTIAEKWSKHFSAEFGFCTTDYLTAKFKPILRPSIFINGSVCPNAQLIEEVAALKDGEALHKNDILIAYRTGLEASFDYKLAESLESKKCKADFVRVLFPEDVFKFNDVEIRADFELLTRGKTSAPVSGTNAFLGDSFFAEEGAEAECSTFNSLQGPIYLAKNTQIWEGCHIRGSFALCENSQVKMGARIYGQTTIGPFSRVGGEINNAVIWGCSSKGHEGYLGNAVIGQWCNIGADSNNSNLKNNYMNVKLWDYEKAGFRNTNMQFCGLIMADHAKCAINTMFNTGTVAGVGANIFGSGFPRNFVPDFAWGGPHGFEVYALNKMLETAARVFERRNIVLDQNEKDILAEVFELTKSYRHF